MAGDTVNSGQALLDGETRRVFECQTLCSESYHTIREVNIGRETEPDPVIVSIKFQAKSDTWSLFVLEKVHDLR